MQVEVRLLGRFEVIVDGRRIAPEPWARRAAASLVKLLALEPGRRLLRDRVIDALWPDLLVAQAAPRLHKATHYARSALGPGSIVTDGVALALWPEAAVTIDADTFERAADDARTDGSAERARQAAALYTGELLPDDLYEPWSEARRSHVRMRWLDLLAQAGMYEQLVAAEPLDEEAHLALVWHHLAAGRRQPALGALDRMAAIFDRELGVTPDTEAEELRRTAEALPIPALPIPVGGEASTVARRGLPAPRSRLIGRDSDVASVSGLLDEHRIVTITGPGGVGKSTLAVASARRIVDTADPPADAVLAELAAARDDYGVVRIVAAAAGIEGEGAIDVPTLAGTLARRGTLLVLDNCEHVLDASARLVDAILDAGPNARVLATSREPLGVVSEVEHRLGSLGNWSAELFVERANAVRPGAAVIADPQVAELCARLDGLPLAIELAAAQLRHLSLPELVGRLDDRLRLSSGRPRAGGRHSALQATIDWSYRLLDEDARVLFEQLGGFPATFDLDAVAAVAACDRTTAAERVGDLVAKSLVVYDGDNARYRLLETVRLFAAERLAVSGMSTTTAERLRAHVIARARSKSRARAWLSTSLAARSRHDIDNVRWAFDACLDQDDTTAAVDVATGLSTMWRNATSYADGRRWVAELLSRELSRSDRIWAEILGADVGLGAGDVGEMRSHADAAAKLAADGGDPSAAVVASIYQAMAHLGTLDLAVARLDRAASAANAADESGLARLARGYHLVARLLSGQSDGARAEAVAMTEGVAERDYALYLCRWAACLVAIVEGDGVWQAKLWREQLDDLYATGLDENWLSVYWGALTQIANDGDFVAELARARAWAESEGRSADADCVFAIAYDAARREDWQYAAELIGAIQGALLHDTAGYIQLALVRDHLVKPALGRDRFEQFAGRGRELELNDVLAKHGL